MKKIIAVLMTLAMLLSLGAVMASAFEIDGCPGVNFFAGKYGCANADDFSPVRTVKITWDPDASQNLDLSDGDMADWVAAGYDMNTVDAANMVSWEGSVENAPEGWTISTYFVADSEYLYIGFYVTDPVFAYGDNAEGYNGDAFQVCIDFGGKMGEQIRKDPTVLNNPKNIFYSFSCMEDGAPLQIMRQEAAPGEDYVLSEANGDGVKGSASKTNTGWCAEFALSFEMLFDDYSWKAWDDDPKIYVGSNERLPLTIGCCLYYMDRSETGGAINWAAGSTNGITDADGNPCVSWTAYDNGITLELDYVEDMTFACENIVVLPIDEETPEESEPETEEPTEAPTVEETEPTTDAATDAATDATTDAATDATTVTGTDAGTQGGDDEGCASVVGFGAVAVLAAAAAAVALKKKD